MNSAGFYESGKALQHRQSHRLRTYVQWLNRSDNRVSRSTQCESNHSLKTPRSLWNNHLGLLHNSSSFTAAIVFNSFAAGKSGCISTTTSISRQSQCKSLETSSSCTSEGARFDCFNLCFPQNDFSTWFRSPLLNQDQFIKAHNWCANRPIQSG